MYTFVVVVVVVATDADAVADFVGVIVVSL